MNGSAITSMHRSRDIWMLLTWLAILLSEVLNAPFRFYAENAGLSAVVYLPKILCTAVVILWLSNLSRVSILVTLTFASAALVAFLNEISPQQIFFGFWIFLYSLTGISILGFVERNEDIFFKTCVAGWLIATIGVIANSYVTYPWVGFGYSIGGVDIEGSREWSTFDVDRLAGFGRASITSACQILILSLFALPRVTKRSRILAVAMFAASAYAIYLTTAKSVAGAYVATIIIWLISWAPYPAFIVSFLLCTATAALPFTTIFITYNLQITSWWTQILLLSLDERLTLTWPLSIELLLRIGDPFFGRGLGGVGSPQKIFSLENPSMYSLSFTDSFSLFMYGTFGVMGVAMLIAISYRACRLVAAGRGLALNLGLASLGGLFIGGATDLIETGIPAVFLGFLIAVGFRARIN